MKNIITLIALAFASQTSVAGENYQTGKIKNITATTDGLMVMMDSGLPSNCEGTPYGWMLIEQKNTTIISVVLAAWASQSKSGTIYTSGRPGESGWCLVNQFDPTN